MPWNPGNRLGRGKLQPGPLGGRHLNAKGYVRLSTGPLRGQYEHRAVMAGMAREFCYYPLEANGLPRGFQVEHVDHKRTHNCAENLLLLDARIHDHLSWLSWLNRPHNEITGQEPPTLGPDDRDPTATAEGRWRIRPEDSGDVPF